MIEEDQCFLYSENKNIFAIVTHRKFLDIFFVHFHSQNKDMEIYHVSINRLTSLPSSLLKAIKLYRIDRLKTVSE